MPARVPIAHERVRASVLYPLDPHFSAVVDKEVDGDSSLPARMEANPSRRISQMHAATRAARAVFLCSAPLVGRPNAGLTGAGLRLACAEPGDQLAIFGEALRELAERATYLYEEAGRYWFSTQPTLNRLADDRAEAFPDHDVDAEITKVLIEDAKTKGGFHRVHAGFDDPINIDEAEVLSLAVLPPSMAHSGKGAGQSPATDAVTDALTRCRSAQRRYRNTLVFVAADEALLATARQATRKAMAWASIIEDRRLRDQLTRAQGEDALDKAKTSKDGAAKAVRFAWSHIFLAVKSEATAVGKPFDLEQVSIASKDRAAIPAAVYGKIGPAGDNLAKEKLGPDALWLHLKPLWPEDRAHLGVNEVAEWFASYVYLPKLRDRVVLETAIRDGAGKLDPAFGYADSVDASTGAYRGLRWAKTLPEILPPSAILVRADVARDQSNPVALADAPTPADTQLGATSPNGVSDTGSTPAAPPKPRRFYGSVEIDPSRPLKAFDAIVNAVILELQRSPTTKVKLTLEIEAQASDGFDDADVGVVRDNARQLKFDPGSTGFD